MHVLFRHEFNLKTAVFGTLPVPSPCIADCVTLTDISRKVGSYYTAFSLAASGLFGDPVAVVGRSKLYSAQSVDAAIAKRNANRKGATKTA